MRQFYGFIMRLDLSRWSKRSKGAYYEDVLFEICSESLQQARDYVDKQWDKPLVIATLQWEERKPAIHGIAVWGILNYRSIILNHDAELHEGDDLPFAMPLAVDPSSAEIIAAEERKRSQLALYCRRVVADNACPNCRASLVSSKCPQCGFRHGSKFPFKVLT